MGEHLSEYVMPSNVNLSHFCRLIEFFGIKFLSLIFLAYKIAN